MEESLTLELWKGPEAAALRPARRQKETLGGTRSTEGR